MVGAQRCALVQRDLAVERAKLEARKQGYTVTERSLSDGSIKLTVNAEGGAL